MKYRPHPVADMFPMLTDEELTALSEDIKTNGQVHPILVVDDLIIDGRNRYAACDMAGIKPVIEEWKGDDVEAFIISTNIHRRHLSAGQRAALVTKILAPDGDWGHGEQAKISYEISGLPNDRGLVTAMSRARVVAAEMPEYLDEVVAGRTTLHTAFTEVKKVIEARESYDDRRDAMVKKSDQLLKEANALLKEKGKLRYSEPVGLPALKADDLKGEGSDAEGVALNASITATERGLEVYAELLEWENAIIQLARNVPVVPVLKGDESLTVSMVKAIEAVIEALRLEGVNITNRLHEQHVALTTKGNLKAVK